MNASNPSSSNAGPARQAWNNELALVFRRHVQVEVAMIPARWTRFFALAAAFTGAIGLGCPAPALAQDYPSHTVTIVVPFPAGGPLDFTARLLAEKLAANLKHSFVIENRPGVAGNIGTEAVAKAAPDGHTLLMVLDTPLTAHPTLYPKLPFDPERDFAPISIVASFCGWWSFPAVSLGQVKT
jgi:hypothetical protein